MLLNRAMIRYAFLFPRWQQSSEFHAGPGAPHCTQCSPTYPPRKEVPGRGSPWKPGGKKRGPGRGHQHPPVATLSHPQSPTDPEPEMLERATSSPHCPHCHHCPTPGQDLRGPPWNGPRRPHHWLWLPPGFHCFHPASIWLPPDPQPPQQPCSYGGADTPCASVTQHKNPLGTSPQCHAALRPPPPQKKVG